LQGVLSSGCRIVHCVEAHSPEKIEESKQCRSFLRQKGGGSCPMRRQLSWHGNCAHCRHRQQGRSNLSWLVVAIIAVCAGFVGTYHVSGNIWEAMNVAGGLAFFYIAGLLIRATRPPVSGRQRAVVLGLSALLLTGVAGHWIVVSSMTRWQNAQLQDIRRRVEYGVMVSHMYNQASPVFATYHRQLPIEKRSLTEVFLSEHPTLDCENHLLMLDSLNDGLKVFATTYGDSRIILTCVSGITAGAEARFRNFDGRTGYMQSRVHLTPNGIDYETQN
jgi:hypothetical protein